MLILGSIATFSDPLMGQLRDGLLRWPNLVTIPAHADRMVPDACRPKRAALNSALRRGRASEVGALADELVRCDARSDARMLHAVRQRRFDDAMIERVTVGRARSRPDDMPNAKCIADSLQWVFVRGLVQRMLDCEVVDAALAFL